MFCINKNISSFLRKNFHLNFFLTLPKHHNRDTRLILFKVRASSALLKNPFRTSISKSSKVYFVCYESLQLLAKFLVWGVVAVVGRDSSQHQWATAPTDRLLWPRLALWQVSQGHLRPEPPQPGQCSHEAWHQVVDAMGVFSTLGTIPHPVSGPGAGAQRLGQSA